MSGVPKNLTENDQRILAMAWHCFVEMPKVDYKKLAEMGGYKTPASATTAYHVARKKLMVGSAAPAAGAGKSATTPTPATPKSTGKKRAAPVSTDGTAKKRGRKSKAEVQAIVASEADADDDETKDEAEAVATTEADAASETKDETNNEVNIKGEGDAEDEDTEKILNGAQDFLDGDARQKVESTDDA